MTTMPAHVPAPDVPVRRLLAVAIGFVMVLVLPAMSRAQPTTPCPAPCAAPPVQGDTLEITLEQALARAAGQSQEVRLARAEVELANAQVTSARSEVLPQLDGSLNYTRTFDSPFNTGGFTIPDSLRFEPDTTAPLAERVRYLERRAPGAALGGFGSLFGNLPFGQQNSYVAALTGTQTLYAGGRVGAALRIADEYRAAVRFGLTEQVAMIARIVYSRVAGGVMLSTGTSSVSMSSSTIVPAGLNSLRSTSEQSLSQTPTMRYSVPALRRTVHDVFCPSRSWPR